MTSIARIETRAQHRERITRENLATAAARRAAGLEFPVATIDLSVNALSLVAPHFAGLFRSDIECQVHMEAAAAWTELGGAHLIGWQFEVEDVLLYAELVSTVSVGLILSVRPA